MFFVRVQLPVRSYDHYQRHIVRLRYSGFSKSGAKVPRVNFMIISQERTGAMRDWC